MRALVVEPAGDRGSLTASRALAAAGWTVGVATTCRPGLADASRSVSRRYPVAAPGDDPDGFIAETAAAVREGGYELVLPGAGDSVLLALSQRRDEIPAQLPLPEHERVVDACDKLNLSEAAGRAGLAVPRTALAEDAGELRRFPFPALVKERLHARLSRSSARSRVEAVIVGSAREAEAQIAVVRAAGGVPLVQELVRGRLAALALVADRDGRIVAISQQISERSWPLAAGPSSRARTVEVDERLQGRAAALVRELGWFGLGELQFIADDADGFNLIDFNGRIYGSIALAVAAGANLPAVWAEVARGGRPANLTVGIQGRRYQWLEGDLRGALAEGSGRLGSLVDCLRYSRGAAHSIWSSRDPRPAVRYLRLRGAHAVRRLLRRGSRAQGAW